MGKKEYQLEEEEENDWDDEENRELRCRQGKGHGEDAIQLSVDFLLPSPLLLLWLNRFASLRSSFASTIHCEKVGFNKYLSI
ncbi:hypothetical protein TSUD_343300 [Trifolium subterraneum]|nr:hypothetical protein TSUD_343300 [Trifolium subterraneum]